MKVITTTVFRSFNYGAVLQAYALHKKINDMGIDCEILNYRPVKSELRFKNVFQRGSSFKELIYNLLGLLKYFESRRKIDAANSFLNRNLKLSKEYNVYSDLLKSPPSADVFLCGSDQIWNPKIHNGLSPIYFLDFIKDKKIIKASFAASVGENSIEEKYKNQIKKYLDTFKHVSVREEKAKEILSFTSKDIKVVADPVFLLNKNEWLKLIPKNKIKKKYILCYFLYQPKFLNSVVKKIKKETGYQVISVSLASYSKIYNDILIRDVGPDGFLSLLANAEIVITSSFHGTALSILMEKEFYSVASPTRGSRITNILEKVGLENRAIHDENFNLNNSINYKIVTPKVEILRKNSLDYLDNVLSLAPEK